MGDTIAVKRPDATVVIAAATNNGNGIPSQEKSDALLEETFYILSKKNTVFKVRLTEKGLCLRKESNGATTKEQTIAISDIIGCRCMRSRRRNAAGGASCVCTQRPKSTESLRVVDENSVDGDESDCSAYLYIYAYVLKRRRRRGATTGRERTTITLRFRSFDRYEDNNKEAQKWRYAIKCLVRGVSIDSELQIDTRKVLILLNPKSGPGKAREFFQQRVAPVLAEAEVPFDLHVTKRANFAREFVRQRDVFAWRAIVAVGGDGIYFEVINGLFERADWRRAVDEIPVGVVPCGSGNGLAKTICHLYNEPFNPKPVLGAALAMVKGRSAPMDLVRVETTNKIMYSFLSVGWGLLADIDIESESLRAIGGQRFTVWSLARLIGLRTYRGEVSYLPASKELLEKRGLDQQQQQQQQQQQFGSDKKHSQTPGGGITHSLSQNLADTLSFRTHGGNNPPMGGGGYQHHLQVCKSCGAGLPDPDEPCDLCDSGFGDALSLETSAGHVVHNHGEGGNDDAEYKDVMTQQQQQQRRERLDSWYSTASRRSAYYSTAGVSCYQSVGPDDDGDAGTLTGGGPDTPVMMYGPAPRCPALTAKQTPPGWVRMPGDEFVMVHASYQAYIGSDCFIAPQSTLNDGIIWLLVIRGGATRAQLLSFLLGLSTGTHVQPPRQDGSSSNANIQMIPVTAFRIVPADGGHGHVTVDGECMEYGPVQGEVFPGLARVIVP